ncbi:MAG: hypothetical protein ACYS1A_19410 [Planctomycetota bacterium]|jgi:cob(I)alamin adenosyltransferase
MPPVGAAIAGLAKAAIAIAPVAAVGVGVHGITESRSQAKKARSVAKKQTGIQAELAREQMEMQEWQAGEYYDISEKQMELQAQQQNIKTLATLIEQKQKDQPGPKVFTLPAAKTTTPVQDINRAIQNLFKAG